MTYIPNPRAASYSKSATGISNTSISNGVYKFLGCSLLSAQMSVGFNSVASSLSVTLVEDIEAADAFVSPAMPSLWGFSLPAGGVGDQVFVTGGFNFDPNALNPTNVPFYFSGLCTSWSEDTISTGGRIITVNLVDPREILTGVQCLLGGFALSQNLGVSTPRFDDIDNVIDVFGYYDHGMESGKNNYGIQWSKVKQAIEAVGVTLNDIDFEFWFSGEAFEDAPEWYRISEETIDIISLCQKVCNDAGSDFVILARKTASDACVVEFRAIKRQNLNPLTQTEINDFLTSRADIVESARVGREYRNEPTSSVVVGGFRNTNYVAYPSTYISGFHLKNDDGQVYESLESFPSGIIDRLFMPNGRWPGASAGKTGAIFPFWGYATTSGNDPMAEPFLPLDYLVFDRNSERLFRLTEKIPLCKIVTDRKQVRTVPHTDIFLDGDGDDDYRPFGVVSGYRFSTSATGSEVRGLPLNTEVLRAALQSKYSFELYYSLYYPEIATSLRMGGFNYDAFIRDANSAFDKSSEFFLHDLHPRNYFNSASLRSSKTQYDAILATAGKMGLNDFNQKAIAESASVVFTEFNAVIYEAVRKYADEHMGKQFVVCLPKSTIMNRIWDGDPVPTRSEKPEIEYIVDSTGYFENVPIELDGIANSRASGTVTGEQELQVVRRFSAEDGRFFPMAIMDWKPSGNASFNSNQLNRVMFQGLSVSEYRPNRIAEGNAPYVYMSCQATSPTKRPDIAIVELPTYLTFEPSCRENGTIPFAGYATPRGADTDYLWREGACISLIHHVLFVKSPVLFQTNFNTIFNKIVALGDGWDEELRITSDKYKKHHFINSWANQMYNWYRDLAFMAFDNERVMDLKGVVIPLTSTWTRYGPWYYTNAEAKGMVAFEIEDNLVPWNFDRSPTASGWSANLDAAGLERLARTLAVTDYVDSATIRVAGFPEYGPATQLGFNSNLTNISIEFGTGGVHTTYNLATYSAKPGTYKKSEFDNVSKSRIDNRARIVDPNNTNIMTSLIYKDYMKNKFPI